MSSYNNVCVYYLYIVVTPRLNGILCFLRFLCHPRGRTGRRWPRWFWIMKGTQSGSATPVISGKFNHIL